MSGLVRPGSIPGLTEVLEQSSEPSSIEARTQSLSTFSGGLGPPDLCRLGKTETRIMGYSEQHFSYHCVLGMDVLDHHSIAAYVHGLMDAIHSPLLSDWRIDSGTYCCFDLFSGFDIRVDVKVPGMPGVAVSCVAPNGDVSDTVPQAVWEGAFLSSYFRYYSLSKQKLLLLPNLQAPQFAPIVHRLMGVFIELSDASGQSLDSPTNVFVEAFAKTYLKQFRLGEAMELFASLQSLYPPIVTYIAQIYLLKDQPDAAISVLLRSLRGCPENDHHLVFLGSILAASEDSVSMAQSASELAVSVGPGNSKTWLFRAQILDSFSPVALGNALSLCSEEKHAEDMLSLDKNGGPLLMGPGTGIATWLDDGEAAAKLVRKSWTTPTETFAAVTLTKCEKAVYKVISRYSVCDVKDENLRRVWNFLQDDLAMLNVMRTELDERGNKPWLPAHSAELWALRAAAARRLQDWTLFEISARMTLIHGPNLIVAKQLLKLYIAKDNVRRREAILVLFQIWFWAAPFCMQRPGHLACHGVPPWLVNLVARTAYYVGSARIRNSISDPRLAVLDQLLLV